MWGYEEKLVTCAWFCQIVFQSGWTLYIPNSSCPHFLLTLGLIFPVCKFCPSGTCKFYLIVILICISLTKLMKFSIFSSLVWPHLWNGSSSTFLLVTFLSFLSLKEFLIYSRYCVLLIACVANIFFQSVACLFFFTDAFQWTEKF